MQFVRKAIISLAILFTISKLSNAQYFVQGERQNSIGVEYRVFIPVVKDNKILENAYGFDLNYKRLLFDKGELGVFAGLNGFKNTKNGPYNEPTNVTQNFSSVGLTFDYYLVNSAEIRFGIGTRIAPVFYNLEFERATSVESYKAMYAMAGLRLPLELKVSPGFYFVFSPEVAYALAINEDEMQKTERTGSFEFTQDFSPYGIGEVIFVNLNFGFRVNF